MDNLKIYFYYTLWSIFHAVDENDWDRLDIKDIELDIKNTIKKITKSSEMADYEPVFLDLDDELQTALITHLRNKDRERVIKVITEILFKTYLI